VLNDGRRLEYSPKRLSGVEVFRAEQRQFATGERIQFRAPERTLKFANGEFATIVAIDERTARIRTEDGRVVEAQANCLRHIDYGYASTSHSSQGATVDRVIVNIDTMRSAELVNRKQFCQQSPNRSMVHGASSIWISGMRNISISSKPPASRSISAARANFSLAL
jgi:hypothetical protein